MDGLFFLEVTLAGLGSGGLYALAALAFVIVYKATRVVNIAIGEFLMMGAYVFYAFAAGMAWPVWAAIAGAVAVSAVLGAVVERVTIRPMLGESPISVFMITVGLASILVGVVELIWTADQRRLPEFMPRAPVMVGEAFVAPKVFYGFWVALALVLLVLAVFRYWRGGVALRATASDQGAAYAMGINVPRVFSLSWAAAGAIAAVSGVIVGAIGGISSSMGVFGLSVLVVVIVGGLDSVAGGARGRHLHRAAGGLGRRLPGRRIQTAGDLRGAGGGADDAALRAVRHARNREAVAMRIATAKETYRADEALFDTATQRLWLALLAASLALFPFVADAYWLYLACLVAINVASATGLNILTGYTGLVSLGQAAFMGLGAYTVAVMELRLGTPVLLNLLGAGVVAMLGGLLVGIPSLRVKGLYLAISTIAASFIAHFVFANWAFTGGTGGLQVPPARLLGIDLDTSFKIYWLIVPLTALMVLGAANLFRTRVGRAFIAIRDRDISAEVLGIHLLRYKLLSFGLSSFYAGVAGGLWAYFFRVVTPESFPLIMSIFFLAAIIVGGMGSILGSILGAVFMTMVPELLKLVVGWLPVGGDALRLISPVRTIVFGLLIVGFLIFEPHGLAEIWRRVRRYFHLWPFRT